ncbi:MAG: 2-amino-4-hydroxy-6-hydroxymethyldihydropteridine diphosphokinase [Zoogloeaceae bacterium]|jgi:2-amino-4-hydroxy-6-hydroxymethyldihydropteridine diphosphokinase|nr:2-amino-4-hydroxy-6-hydroxymethyldihydropteridine diphosphokinase [Zoogloeaceae bacterium]
MTVIAYIGLGANLGDAVATLRAATTAIGRLPHTRLIATSSFWRSAPVGCAVAQPDFVNAVVEIDTTLSPGALLDHLFQIEAAFGRERPFANAPRTLDLDLLLFSHFVLDSPKLTLPHPRLHLRAFALLPLLELAPEISLPGRGAAAAWLPAVASQSLEKLSGEMADVPDPPQEPILSRT